MNKKLPERNKEYGNNRIIERRHFIRHPISLPLIYKVIKSGVGYSRVDSIGSEKVLDKQDK